MNIEQMAPLPLPDRTMWQYGKQIDHYTADQMREYAALVRAQALEEAAAVCDVTPPYPFRPSIKAAHAIRALKASPDAGEG